VKKTLRAKFRAFKLKKEKKNYLARLVKEYKHGGELKRRSRP
jgi:hypothetical protein